MNNKQVNWAWMFWNVIDKNPKSLAISTLDDSEKEMFRAHAKVWAMKVKRKKYHQELGGSRIWGIGELEVLTSSN